MAHAGIINWGALDLSPIECNLIHKEVIGSQILLVNICKFDYKNAIIRKLFFVWRFLK
jgi:hypothetical protein